VEIVRCVASGDSYTIGTSVSVARCGRPNQLVELQR